MTTDLVSFAVVAVGLVVLVVLAAAAGHADSASRAAAWRRIAAARRELWERDHVIGCRRDGDCGDCPFRPV